MTLQARCLMFLTFNNPWNFHFLEWLFDFKGYSLTNATQSDHLLKLGFHLPNSDLMCLN